MLKLLVIADDFTGALDTGVQFAKKGLPVLVYAEDNYSIQAIRDKTGVLVVNSETRHLSPKGAYEKVRTIAEKAMGAGVNKFYKKTDSALRGNIGSELAAIIAVTGEKSLYFFPAYPKNGRTTKAGIQYLDGIPIAGSVFGKDPFEPVLLSSIPDIIGQQSDIRTVVVGSGEAIPVNNSGEPLIYIFDSETDRDLCRFAGQLKERKGFAAAAGCAGFAEYIPDLFDFEPSLPRAMVRPDKVLFVSGSLNPVSLAQIDYAKKRRYPLYTLTSSKELGPGYCETSDFAHLVQEAKKNLESKGVFLLAVSGESARESRTAVSHNISLFTESIAAGVENLAFVVFGGDTALSVAGRLFCGSIRPLGEIEAGVAVSEGENAEGKPALLVTKSGGFGKPDLVEGILQYLQVSS